MKPIKSLELEWSDQYRSGFDRIDEAHKELFRITNGLWSEKSTPLELYEKALVYVTEHFEEEEGYMVHLSLQEVREHQDDHVRLQDLLLSYWREAKKDVSREAQLHSLLFIFFQEELIPHIKKFDVLIRRYDEKEGNS